MKSGVVVLLALLASPIAGEAPGRSIGRVEVVDDLGKGLGGGLTLCGVTREARTCTEYVSSAPTKLPPGLETLEVEGPAHGPVELSGKAIEPDDTGTLRVVVPRKARLRFPNAEPRTVSLYAIDDPDMVRPRFRASVTGEEVLFPAGAFVASILGAGEDAAPDLRLLPLQPGETAAVSPVSRKGWSLVVKVTEGREPLEGAAVQLRRRDASEGSPVPRVASGTEGFALFSGLAAGDTDVEVSRKGFVPAKRPWTSARNGTFAFRHVPLERAGAIVLRLESGSLNVADVPCRLLDNELQRPARDSAGRKTLQAGRTDDAGRVRFDDVPPGRWAVRIQPGGRFGFDEGVDVESGRATEKTVALERIPVSGSVMRAGEPIAAATVQIRAHSSAGLPGDDEGFVRAKTGEDGRYEAEVFSEGPHDFVLFLENIPVDTRRAWVPKGGTEVDFDLNEHSLGPRRDAGQPPGRRRDGRAPARDLPSSGRFRRGGPSSSRPRPGRRDPDRAGFASGRRSSRSGRAASRDRSDDAPSRLGPALLAEGARRRPARPSVGLGELSSRAPAPRVASSFEESRRPAGFSPVARPAH